MYLYEIEDLINHKCYIGISSDYQRRWKQHKRNAFSEHSKEYEKPLYRAFRKYGLKNFSFQLLKSGLSVEKASESEKEEIIKQKSLASEWGYNISKGGMFGTSVSKYGAENSNAHLTVKEAQYILDHRNLPEYVLYFDFEEKLTYDAFRNIYRGKTYTNLSTETQMYPFNFEFSCQFCRSKLEYPEVVELRQAYANGETWDVWYEKYKDIFPNKWDFWNIYNGNRYKLVMPEVFTAENKHKHSSMSNRGSKNGRAKLTEDDVKQIRLLHKNGASNKEIYESFPQVTSTTIRNIIDNKTWTHVIID